MRTGNQQTIPSGSERPATPPDEAAGPYPKRQWIPVAVVTAAALVLGIVPNLVGYLHTPRGGRFVGQIFVIDDYCVYLSWLRQAADGHWLALNLFTTDKQSGLEFNILFLLLGRVAALTRMPLDIVLLGARVAATAAVLWVVCRLYRLCAGGDGWVGGYAIAALGSGLGWLHQLKQPDIRGIMPSADSNQPEALLFTATYFSAINAVGTLLIVASMLGLLLSMQRRRTRYAVGSGLALLVLGNIHGYDVIHVAAAWTLFLLVDAVRTRRVDLALLGRSALAGLIAVPSVAYQYYVLRHETVFYQRAMEVTTLTPSIDQYLIGYGFVLVLALLAVRLLIVPDGGSEVPCFGSEKHGAATPPSTSRPAPSLTRPLLCILCWAVAGIAVAYAPFPFQRKLIMGEDVPLSLLAGLGAAWLSRAAVPVDGMKRNAVVALLVLCTIPSTILFLARDMVKLADAPRLAGRAACPYLSAGELDVLAYLRNHTSPHAAVLATPRISLFVPGFCDRPVWAGHWGETPHCIARERLLSAALDAGAPPGRLESLIRDGHVAYVCYPNDPRHASLAEITPQGLRRAYAPLATRYPDFLTPVHRNSEYTILAVRWSSETAAADHQGADQDVTEPR
ncbi:MAG: hypothetical protein ACLQVD_07135 [Capsulimonadaceae bacterium]